MSSDTMNHLEQDPAAVNDCALMSRTDDLPAVGVTASVTSPPSEPDRTRRRHAKGAQRPVKGRTRTRQHSALRSTRCWPTGTGRSDTVLRTPSRPPGGPTYRKRSRSRPDALGHRAGVNPLTNNFLNMPAGLNLMDNRQCLPRHPRCPGHIRARTNRHIQHAARRGISLVCLRFLLHGSPVRQLVGGAFVGGLLYGFSPYAVAEGTGHLSWFSVRSRHSWCSFSTAHQDSDGIAMVGRSALGVCLAIESTFRPRLLLLYGRAGAGHRSARSVGPRDPTQASGDRRIAKGARAASSLYWR